VFLGSPALLGNGNGGPLANAGTNGHVALAGPAGRLDRPGVMLGAEDTGLYAPAANALAAVAAGTEVLRADATGTVTLGAASGAHGFQVGTPANAVNRVLASGAATGGIVSLAANGADANIPLALASKGTGTLRLQARSGTSFEVSAAATPVNYLRATGTAAGGQPQLSAQGSDANITLQLAPKGTAPVQTTAPFQLPTYTVATLPSAATFVRCIVHVSDGTANKRFAISDGTSWRWPDGAVVT
jgi:phosphotransferase system HPr-like phosphotransfer protein